MFGKLLQKSAILNPYPCADGRGKSISCFEFAGSGSLKDLARVYQVSYPRIRAWVNRMIESLQQAVAGELSNPATVGSASGTRRNRGIRRASTARRVLPAGKNAIMSRKKSVHPLWAATTAAEAALL